MNKPKVRFKGYTDAWEQRKLGEVFVQTANYVNPNNDEIELWSLTVEEGLTPKSERYNREFLVKKDTNFKEVRPGDIVYNPMNMTLGAVGFNRMTKSVAVSGYYTTMVANEGYDSYYINTWLKSPQAISLYKIFATGSLKEKQRVQFPTLSIIPATFPKYEEQTKIGSYFANLDTLITLHQRKCEETKKLKKYMLQKMFPKDGESVPEIRFSGFTDAWEQRKLGEVAKYRNGKAHENEINEDGAYIVINSKFVSTNGEVIKYSNSQNEPLYKNEIAFVLSDVPNGRAIARTFLVDKSGKYTLNQRIAGITPLEDTDPYFLHILMNRNPYFLKFDDGNKQTNLSVKDVMEFEEYYPLFDEQKKIGSSFRQLDHLITLHQRKCEELQNMKKYMLQNMFA